MQNLYSTLARFLFLNLIILSPSRAHCHIFGMPHLCVCVLCDKNEQMNLYQICNNNAMAEVSKSGMNPSGSLGIIQICWSFWAKIQCTSMYFQIVENKFAGGAFAELKTFSVLRIWKHRKIFEFAGGVLSGKDYLNLLELFKNIERYCRSLTGAEMYWTHWKSLSVPVNDF